MAILFSLKYYSLKSSKSDIFSSKVWSQKFLISHETLHFDRFEDAANMTILFQTHSPKYPNKAFLVRILLLLLFCTIFCTSANFRVLIPNISIVFSNSKSKNTQKDIFGLKFKDFSFCMKLFKTFNPKLHKKGILGSKLETFCVARVAFSKV